MHCVSGFLTIGGEEGAISISVPSASLTRTSSFPECTELPLRARCLHSIEVGSSSAHGAFALANIP